MQLSGVRSRILTVTSAMVAALALTGVVAPAATAVPAGGWAPAAEAPIRPGVLTEISGAGACTANFVFTRGGRVYLGTAAHCAGRGNATDTNGCRSESMPLGTPVTIHAADGSQRTGSLAYSSWLAMQQAGETDADACAFNDFALIEIDPTDVGDVNPTVPHFGGPVGIDRDGTQSGELVYSYGNSPLRLGIQSLNPKFGVAVGDVGNGWSHDIFTVTPGVPGDSGSAVLDSDGEALGVLSTLNVVPVPGSNGVSDLAALLNYATTHGFDGLRLALGTEPFTASPPGVRLPELPVLQR